MDEWVLSHLGCCNIVQSGSMYSLRLKCLIKRLCSSCIVFLPLPGPGPCRVSQHQGISVQASCPTSPPSWGTAGRGENDQRVKPSIACSPSLHCDAENPHKAIMLQYHAVRSSINSSYWPIDGCAFPPTTMVDV